MSRIAVAAASALLASSLSLPAQEEPEGKAEPEKQAQEKQEEAKGPMTSGTFAGLALRSIGPAITSGRVGDIVVDPTDKSHWYVAACSGGVWETHDRGTSWKAIFDGQKSYSIGCIAIDPRDPLTVWVGSGENNSQRSVSYGDGVYKSTDGGRTWKNTGLRDSQHIGVIVIDPRDSQRVFVAAQGPLWSGGGDRGLYLTEDGGTTWHAVLEIDEHTGVTDLVMDPRNPDVLIAASYQRARRVWTLIDGGPGSGIHKSTDGGRTWKKSQSGLPGGDLGRIGLAIATTAPYPVYAIVEAQADKGGFYRSTDMGASWQKQSDYVAVSPQYYQELFVDPVDADRVYSMDVFMKVTEDGGKSWNNVPEKSKHVDNHALWIDPHDTRHLIAGCDGGVYETYDRGGTWQFKGNLPITQFYKITADNDSPFYNVYGGTQDNFSLGGPARTTSSNGITNREWFMTLGGDGFQTVVDPTDPDVVYSEYQHGGLVRYDRRTGETIDIKPHAADGAEPLRWNWSTPLMISPHSNTRLYFAANYLFRSDDRGQSWRVLGDNLTRQVDRNGLEIMGKVWPADAVSKSRSTSVYGNIVALSESPVKEGRLYVGTDDGMIQCSGDGGESWRAVIKVDGVPEMTYVSAITASQHEAMRVYAAFDNHKRGDFKPYLYRSTDGGEHWKSIAGDLPERGSVYCIVEDHVEDDLLFCGTEYGVFFTFDGGEKWIQLKGGMPPIAVRDLAIQRRESDLVVGTFGRGIYVLDDYSPLRVLTEKRLEEPAFLCPPRRTWLFVESTPLGRGGKGFQGDAFYTAPNPPAGAVFTYHLAEGLKTREAKRHEAESEAAKADKPVPYPTWDELRAEDREKKPRVLLTVRDAAGAVVRRVDGSTGKGLHRTTWDLRYASPGGGRGPLAAPGRYSVSVSTLIDGALVEVAGPQMFSVELLPGAKFPAIDPAEVLAFQEKAADLQRAVRDASEVVRDAGARIDALDAAILATPGADRAWLAEVHALRESLDDLQVKLHGDSTITSRNEAAPPSIASRAQGALGSFGSTGEPTQTQRDSYDIAAEHFGRFLSSLSEILARVGALEERVEAAGGPTPARELPKWKKR